MEVSLKEGVARVQLAPNNTVQVGRIRDAVKGVGFTPKEARVTVRGKPANVDGKWVFQVEGIDQSYSLADAKSNDDLRRAQGKIVTVEGVLAEQTDPRTPPALDVTTIRASD